VEVRDLLLFEQLIEFKTKQNKPAKLLKDASRLKTGGYVPETIISESDMCRLLPFKNLLEVSQVERVRGKRMRRGWFL